MKRILLGLVTIVGAVSVMYIGVTGAFFSDTESSTGNVFAAGAIDLLVDNESYYNGNECANVGTEEDPVWQWQGSALYPVPGTPCTTSWELDNLTGHLFFNFTDIKPGDEGEDTISLHVQNDAWACMNIALTSNDDNSSTEPELDDGDVQDDPNDIWDGELAGAVEMIWWADDGDNVLEDDENIFIQPGSLASFLGGGLAPGTTTIVLADSEDNVWGEPDGTPMPANDTVYIAKAWCFGSIGTDPVAAGQGENPSIASGVTCNGDNLDNSTQTDSATLDVSFEAVQARNNPDFTCDVPDIVRECEVSEEFASSFHDVDQGDRKNGTAVLPDRSNANAALGGPQSAGTPYDNPVVAGSFFSLGFFSQPPDGTATTTPGGSIVLEFPGLVVQGTGPDLKLWEVTGGTSYPDELVRVEVSNSLAGPWTLVAASVTRDAEMELPVASAKYVRITDVSPPGLFEPTADGYDLDAVQALNCEIPAEV